MRDERRGPSVRPGTAWERTPWHAAQRAAWEALKKTSLSGVDGISPIWKEAE
jgi:hypothetical protein